MRSAVAASDSSEDSVLAEHHEEQARDCGRGKEIEKCAPSLNPY